jgi:hypothetical protein
MDTVQCIDGNLRKKDIRHMDTADLRSWQIDDASDGWLLKIGGRCRQSDTLDRYVPYVRVCTVDERTCR